MTWVIICWYLILLNSSSYLFSVSVLSSIRISVRYLPPLISSIYPLVLLIKRHRGFKTVWCHISNVGNSVFVWFVIYLGVIRIKIFDIMSLKKIICTIFDISLILLTIFHTINFSLNNFCLASFFFQKLFEGLFMIFSHTICK